mmetsp:Transcript_16693/g.34306  ORF Transcript_16693/g.34306 Transcript_16693/m.34306 type:complete len:91 (+) Transcript_16693:4109-4381(+)
MMAWSSSLLPRKIHGDYIGWVCSGAPSESAEVRQTSLDQTHNLRLTSVSFSIQSQFYNNRPERGFSSTKKEGTVTSSALESLMLLRPFTR